MNFIDENCVVFDGEEENKLEYTTVHENFKKVVENLLEGVMNELCITPEQFVGVVAKGRANSEHKRVFDQILAVDNFLSFKKLMVKRNRELECEAMEALSSTNQVSIPEDEIQGAQLRSQEAELEHAIAVSLALEEERQAQMRREEEMLEQALKLSTMEFEQQKDKERMDAMLLEASQKQMQQTEQLQQAQAQVQAQPIYPQIPQSSNVPEPVPQKEQSPPPAQQTISNPEPVEQRIEQPPQQVVEKAKKPVKPKSPPRTIASLEESKADPSKLPPLKSTSAMQQEVYDTFAQNQQQNVEMQQKIQDKIGKEGLKERQERLRAQRDLLLKRKMAERDQELKDYMEETSGTGMPELPANASSPQAAAGVTVSQRLSKYQDMAQKVKHSLTGDSQELQEQIAKAREIREQKQQLM